MNIKISGKIPIGAEFTSKERRAMEKEIQRQLVEYNEKNAKELCAMILWVLHTEFNFGKKRLYKFYKAFSTEIDALAKRYLMDDCKPDKRPWLCIQKLERDGIFIDEWERTVNNGNSEV